MTTQQPTTGQQTASRRPPRHEATRSTDPVDFDELTVRELIERTGLRIGAREFVREVEVVVGARTFRAVKVTHAERVDEFDRSTRAALERIGADFTPFPGDRPHPADIVHAAFVSLLVDSDTPDAVARHLDRDVSRVRQRIRDHTLWAIKSANGARLPRVQFEDDGAEITGMGEVLAALPPNLHPVSLFRFLTTPNPALSLEDSGIAVSPRDWLRSGGRPKIVASIARDLHVV